MSQPLTPFEELQQHVGPNGSGCKKPCPGDGVAGRGGSVEHSLCHCTRCDDTAYILDTEAPLFKAMWEYGGWRPDGVVFHPRSRAEAWYRLSAIHGHTYDWQYAEHDHPLDALCAALLAALKVKEATNA